MRLIRPIPNCSREGDEELSEKRDFVAADVISRHPAGKTQVRYNEAGFFWSWTFMKPRRWKNISNKSSKRDSIKGQAAGSLQKVIFGKISTINILTLFDTRK